MVEVVTPSNAQSTNAVSDDAVLDDQKHRGELEDTDTGENNTRYVRLDE